MTTAMPPMSQITHRPYPPVSRRWIMHMRWHDLAFLHWPVDPAVLRPLVPTELQIDTYDGRAWIGIIPFWMTNVRLRGLPALPTVGSFQEINVRTYVTDGGRAGVWFLSLDAHSRLGAALARRWYRLNYRYAKVTCEHDGQWVSYASRRVESAADFVARYRPAGDPFRAEGSTLEHWLCERYCLYAGGFGRPVLRGEIHHGPWELQRCECRIEVNTMVSALGLTLPGRSPHSMYARQMDVVAWAPGRMERRAASVGLSRL